MVIVNVDNCIMSVMLLMCELVLLVEVFEYDLDDFEMF